MSEVQVCTACGVEKPVTDYYMARGKRRTQCKQYMIAKRVEWQRENRDKLNAYHRENRKSKPDLEKNRRLKYRFGITLDDFNAMALEQDNKCRICDTSFDDTQQGACVDHCHMTEQVRGLLCTDCNKGLGMFKDNTDNLSRAIDYLLTARKIHVTSIASAEQESDI